MQNKVQKRGRMLAGGINGTSFASEYNYKKAYPTAIHASTSVIHHYQSIKTVKKLTLHCNALGLVRLTEHLKLHLPGNGGRDIAGI